MIGTNETESTQKWAPGPRQQSLALWAGASALITAMLFTTACGQLNQSPTTAQPAPTDSPTNQLNWTERTVPPGLAVNQTDGRLIFAFSSVDDQNGWLCAPNADGTFTLWATADQARSWHTVQHPTPSDTDIPGQNGSPHFCTVVLDGINPHVLVLNFSHGCGECGNLGDDTYISNDDGATWHTIPGSNGVSQVITLDQQTYVLGTPGSNDVATPASLYVSDQTFTNWRFVGPANPTNKPFYFIYADPTSSALLITDQYKYWFSANGGSPWTPFTPTYFLQGGGATNWALASNSWRVCEAEHAAAPQSAPSSYCAMDFSKFGTTLPALPSAANGENCFNGIVAANGSLVVSCQPGTPGDNSLPTTTVAFYSLAVGATTWQALTPAPDSIANPFPTPIPGVASGDSADPNQVIFGGKAATHGLDVWYFRPTKGILAVATLAA